VYPLASNPIRTFQTKGAKITIDLLRFFFVLQAPLTAVASLGVDK
jgi:hypothetical protein